MAQQLKELASTSLITPEFMERWAAVAPMCKPSIPCGKMGGRNRRMAGKLQSQLAQKAQHNTETRDSASTVDGKNRFLKAVL